MATHGKDAMTITDFCIVMVRELRALQRELQAYPDDETPWRLAPGITNSAGTLALHLTGNLRHFVGAVLGGSGYVRDRDAEFARRGVPRAELVAGIELAIAEVESAIRAHDDARLGAAYPVPVGGRQVTTSQFLVHLVAHLGYHLGQVDYHRRMTDPAAKPVGTLPLDTLAEIVA